MDELAKKLAELSDQYGPHVVEAARGAARMAAYSRLQGNLIALAVAIVLGLVGRWAWIVNSQDDDGMPFGRIGAIVLFLIGGICLICAIGGLTDPWLYATLHNPDLWIAKKVLKL